MLGVSRHEGSANTMVTILGQAGALTKASLRGVTSMWTCFGHWVTLTLWCSFKPVWGSWTTLWTKLETLLVCTFNERDTEREVDSYNSGFTNDSWFTNDYVSWLGLSPAHIMICSMKPVNLGVVARPHIQICQLVKLIRKTLAIRSIKKIVELVPRSRLFMKI